MSCSPATQLGALREPLLGAADYVVGANDAQRVVGVALQESARSGGAAEQRQVAQLPACIRQQPQRCIVQLAAEGQVQTLQPVPAGMEASE